MYKYQHGGNAAFEPGGAALDLSANINPAGAPEGVEAAIVNALADITRYPDNFSRELRTEIGKWEGFDPERIFCGNGASDIIFRLPAHIKPKEALLPVPSFSDYERALRTSGAKIKYHFLKEERGFSLDGEIIQVLGKENPGLLFVCNPNNPTGILTERSVIEELAEECAKKGAVIVVDECFMDFVENAGDYTAKPLLEKYGNMVILKAFTKVFAMPGIRLGYALCGGGNAVEGLYGCGADWAVSNIAQAAGIAALKNAGEYLKESVEYISRERAFIKKGLEELKCVTYDSRANFLFFKSPIANLPGRLNSRGIRIRDCGNYEGLSEGFCRVGISRRHNNKTFIRELNSIWT